MSRAYPHLFSQARIGRQMLKNRIVMSPMDTNFTTPDGAVTFANHAPNLSCVQANQLVDRFFTVETARARPGGGAGERGSGGAAPRPAGNLAPGDSF